MICHFEGHILGYNRYDLYLFTIIFVLIMTYKLKLLPERVLTFYIKHNQKFKHFTVKHCPKV